ncbi:MAG: class I SAM-dependent methyltransferase [Bryobacteraceae bacterium]
MTPQSCATTSYGRYILGTGEGLVGQIETVWGRFWYDSRFRGKRPVADVGPGRCWFTRQNAGAIIAVDNAPDLVQHYAAEGLQTKLGRAEAMPFPDNRFEGIFCCWLFEHLPDPERAILELHRVLKPGGLCTIVVPTPVDMVAFYADFTHIRPFTAASLPASARRIFPGPAACASSAALSAKRQLTATLQLPTAIYGVSPCATAPTWCWMPGNSAQKCIPRFARCSNTSRSPGGAAATRFARCAKLIWFAQQCPRLILSRWQHGILPLEVPIQPTERSNH